MDSKAPLPDDIPNGYRPLETDSEFVLRNGPLFEKCVAGDLDGFRYSLALKVGTRHSNGLGMCHGGLILTLADSLTGFAARLYLRDNPVVTVSLNTDFSGSAKIGDWILGNARITNETKSLVFVSSELQCGGRPIAITQAVWKKMKPEFGSSQLTLG